MCVSVWELLQPQPRLRWPSKHAVEVVALLLETSVRLPQALFSLSLSDCLQLFFLIVSSRLWLSLSQVSLLLCLFSADFYLTISFCLLSDRPWPSSCLLTLDSLARDMRFFFLCESAWGITDGYKQHLWEFRVPVWLWAGPTPADHNLLNSQLPPHLYLWFYFCNLYLTPRGLGLAGTRPLPSLHGFALPSTNSS